MVEMVMKYFERMSLTNMSDRQTCPGAQWVPCVPHCLTKLLLEMLCGKIFSI